MIIKRVTAKEETAGIKKLQAANLKANLSEEEIQQEGFVTAEYTLPFLELMNEIEPSVIAKEGEEVVGYVLVVTRALYGKHALLDDLFRQIDKYTFNGEALKDIDYTICGQLCVARTHRGRGLVQQMYNYYREALSGKYKYLLTDVDEQNPRSVKAHSKTGFEIIGTSHYGGSNWHIVLWNWNGK
jgi:ribosomal protein S18 acetylase RimI-like enzyme